MQLAWKGFYWQFLPGYILLALVSLLHHRRSTGGGAAQVISRSAVATLLVAFAAAWAFLPVPRLTKPRGRYSLGTKVYRWVDVTRPEAATADPDDRRNVVAQVWYPASSASHGVRSAYMDGLGRLPDYVSVLPRFVMSNYHQIQTNATIDAPLSTDRDKWPVVLFSPGYAASRAFYTSLVTDLASKGYAVIAIDHPYEAAVVELADGRLVTTVENFGKHGADRGAYMTEHLDLRAGDVKFVLDQLHRADVVGPALFARLDLDHIGAIGHSFGGATAALALERDSRIKAAANIDGTLYGDLAEKSLQRPFLLLQSDPAETHHSERYLSGNRQLLQRLHARGYRYEIRGANHYGFTDVPLFFSAPGRLVLAQLIGGPRDVAETHQAATDIIAAFLQEPLTGEPRSVQAVAQRYSNIAGGLVNPRSQTGSGPLQ
ncbi:MAG: hypothetical protein JNK87_01685 [Bryobacterales bacterium]|nr:hypothetical protein [Bryobacterales bacterium]